MPVSKPKGAPMCAFCNNGPETMVGISAAGMMFTKLKMYVQAKWATRGSRSVAADCDVAGAPSA